MKACPLMPAQPGPASQKRFDGRCAVCWLLLLLPLGCSKSDEGAEPAPPPISAGTDKVPKDRSEALQPVETGVERPAGYFGDKPGDRSNEPSPEVPQQKNAEPEIQKVVRLTCIIPEYDLEELATAGILKYESERMILYTDIEPEIAKTLPPLIDQVYPQWEEYFRPLPPAADGSPFRIVGYLMRNRETFDRLRLTHPDLPYFTTGRHRGNRFWMIDQETEYFRRHLMLHEATHCFMTIVPQIRCPIWYLEGTAEFFGTHKIDAAGKLITRVMPDNTKDFDGWGRIGRIQEERDAGRAYSFNQVLEIESINVEREAFEYAWCWAICEFLDAHPRYRDRFRSLRDHWYDASFGSTFRELFAEDALELQLEWLLFVWDVTLGYDVAAAAIDFRPDDSGFNRPAVVATNRGWQSSGWRLEAGTTYEIAAKGQFTLAADPKPWVSEPQGITIRYFAGKPLGRLVGIVIDDQNLGPTGLSRVPDDFAARMKPIDIGSGTTFKTNYSGTLYLRVNDAWSELADNTGQIEVSIRVAAESGAKE